MADPQVPGGVRAQVVLEHDSTLPEDNIVTTWAFDRGAVGYADAADDVAQRLQEFYDTAVSPTPAVRTFLGSQLTGNGLIKVYDLEDPPPRIPTEYEFTMTIGTTEGLPSEVAVCASFYSFVNQPSFRGRVYVGPLSKDASAAGASNEPRPNVDLRDALANASLRLASYGDPLWCVLSQVDAELRPVTNGWVDDAFDIQRRRGPDPTLRSSWGLP